MTGTPYLLVISRIFRRFSSDVTVPVGLWYEGMVYMNLGLCLMIMSSRHFMFIPSSSIGTVAISIPLFLTIDTTSGTIGDSAMRQSPSFIYKEAMRFIALVVSDTNWIFCGFTYIFSPASILQIFFFVRSVSFRFTNGILPSSSLSTSLLTISSIPSTGEHSLLILIPPNEMYLSV